MEVRAPIHEGQIAERKEADEGSEARKLAAGILAAAGCSERGRLPAGGPWMRVGQALPLQLQGGRLTIPCAQRGSRTKIISCLGSSPTPAPDIRKPLFASSEGSRRQERAR